jgi:mono/diheme cytochrome c family protein
MYQSRKLRTLIPLCAAMMFAVSAYAADKFDAGKFEYDGSCAACHGPKGKGDGPVAGEFTRRPPDLSVLAKNNNGVFPFDRIYQIIDGRSEVRAHGTRDMPVWGERFNLQTSLFFENYPPTDPESAARSRIMALTEYIYRLQGK